MEMDDNKRRRNMILYVLIAFVVYLVLSTVLSQHRSHAADYEDRLLDVCQSAR